MDSLPGSGVDAQHPHEQREQTEDDGHQRTALRLWTRSGDEPHVRVIRGTLEHLDVEQLLNRLVELLELLLARALDAPRIDCINGLGSQEPRHSPTIETTLLKRA